MKILFVRPPHHDPRFALTYGAEPLALETIAGAVSDCDLALLDLQFATETLDQVLRSFSPEIVASTGYTADVYRVNAILRAAKQHDPRILTVVGGHHATIDPAAFNFPWIDVIVLGMGEEALREIVRSREQGSGLPEIKGLALPSSHTLTFTAPRPAPSTLDLAPFPRRDLSGLPRERYRLFGEPFALLNTARGCPYQCSFCSIVNEMKGRYLTKSPDRVLSELLTIPEPLVRFADGNTFGNLGRMRALQERVRAASLRKKYLFDIRADTVVTNAGLLESWREVGLEYVAVGFEAITNSRLTALNKGTTTAKNEEAINILHRNGIRIIAQFMVDPDFDDLDFDNLLAFVDRHAIEVPKFSITTPLPGTPLFQQTEAQLTTKDYRKFDCMHPVLPTKMPQDAFYARFLALYQHSYSLGARANSARDWERASGRSAPSLLGTPSSPANLPPEEAEGGAPSSAAPTGGT
jgi:radical SAM superfamily enzyme YgiQ (UPF0313 family)